MASWVSELLQPAVQQFIQQHAHEQPAQLALQKHKYAHLPINSAIAQIQARQKAKDKLPLWHRTPGVLFAPGIPLEQASSQHTAQYKASLVRGGNAFADLTGGTGIDCFYLSACFTQSRFVEQQQALCQLARHNFTALARPNIQVHHQSAETFLKNLTEPLDCIYLDPARRHGHKGKVFYLADCSPDVTTLYHLLKNKARQILIKTSPMLDITASLHNLPGTSLVVVLAVNNEVKEVLYLINTDQDIKKPNIRAVNLANNHEEVFAFTQEGEQHTEVNYSMPQAYIYEPNAAVLKAGAFKSVASAFALSKLHQHSHLYTSAEVVADFPGRSFRLLQTITLNKKAVRAAVPEGKANITVRNFPATVSEIRKKTGLKDGGHTYLFATTLCNNQPRLLICQKT